MVFLLDTELPHNKNVLIALTTIYGIGRTKSSSICRKAGITSSMKVAELTQEHVEKITDIVKNSGIDFSLWFTCSRNVPCLNGLMDS